MLATLACFPVFALNSVARGLLQGAVRFGAIAAFQVTEVLVKMVVGVVLVAGFGVGADAVPISFLLGALAGLAISVAAARDLAPGRGPISTREEYLRAAPMLAGAAGVALLVTVDVLVLAGIRELVGLTTAGIAVYQVAAIVARTPYFVGDALTDASFPFIARAADASASHRQMQVVIRRLVLWVLPLELALLLRPQPVVQAFFPGHYADAASLVQLLALGTLGAVAANALGKALQARDLRREAARAVLLGLGVQVAAIVVGVALWGTRGAAAGFALGTWTAAVALGRRYAEVDGHALPSQMLRRAAPAVLAAAAVLLLPADGSPLVGLIQIAAAIAVYFATLIATRLLSEQEVEGAFRSLGTLLRRKPRAPRERRERSGGRFEPFVRRPGLVIAGAGVLAFLILGANVARSPDTIYDEAVYTRAAQAVATHGEVTWTGAPLFVHPPLFFVMQAAVQRIAGVAHSDYFAILHVERLVSVAFMAGAIVLLMLIALRLAAALSPGRRLLLALGVGALAAFDPVLVRYGRLTMLESTALCLSLGAIWASLALRGRRAGTWIATVGVLSGIALLVKEISIFLIVAPLLTALLDREREAIRRAGAALGVALLVWSSFPLWAILLGDWGRFSGDKLRTLDRLLGVVQTTGWNRPGVSIADALTASLPQYASSYLLLVTGGAALVWMWLRHGGRTATFLLGLLLPTYALGVYSITRGQFNEQFFTYLMPGAILASAIGAHTLVSRALAARGSAARPARAIGLGAAAALAGALVFGVGSWGRYQAFGSDDAIRSAAAFVRTELPECAVVNASGDREKYATASGRRFSEFASGPAALSHGVHYFFVSPKDVAARYTSMTRRSPTGCAATGASSGRSTAAPTADSSSGTSPAAGLRSTTSSPCREASSWRRARRPAAGSPSATTAAAAFASAYVRLGGRQLLGPPVSRRFARGERTLQAFERARARGRARSGRSCGEAPGTAVPRRRRRGSPRPHRPRPRRSQDCGRRHDDRPRDSRRSSHRPELRSLLPRRASAPRERGPLASSAHAARSPARRTAHGERGRPAGVLERGARARRRLVCGAARVAGLALPRDRLRPALCDPDPGRARPRHARPSLQRPERRGPVPRARRGRDRARARPLPRLRRQRRRAGARGRPPSSLLPLDPAQAPGGTAMTVLAAELAVGRQPPLELPPLVVDGRVIQDRYHGIGRQTFELLRELGSAGVELEVLVGDAPDTRLSVHDLPRLDNLRLVPFGSGVASAAQQLAGRAGCAGCAVGF